MEWTVTASFFSKDKPDWLTPYVPGNRHQFRYVPRRDALANMNWHDRPSALTGHQEWLGIWQQSGEAARETKGGILTVLQQAALTAGIRQRLARRKIPVVAWWFNVGACYPGLKAQIAHHSMKEINRFVVHTRCEQKIYSQWLGIPIERFEFVPLQCGEIPVTHQENTDRPFVLATGSAYRDFPTLFEAVSKLNLRTIVVSGHHALEGLDIPPQVETPFGLKKAEIWQLVQEARVNVVPMVPAGPTAGTVTIVEAMRMGRAVVATRRSGVDDYIEDEKTGLLVSPSSVADLAEAIDRVWNDQPLRQQLGAAAKQYAIDHFSDEAAGAAMGRILDSVADETGFK